MNISIVVPAFNEERLLADSLAHITAAAEAFLQRGWQYDVIVCDNNSTDRTAEIAREAGARVVFEPFNQIARARNSGAAAATGEWLLFVDADSRPSAALLGDVAEAIASGRYVAGSSTIQLDETHVLAALFVLVWNWSSRTERLLAGSFIFVQTAAFRTLGGFSTALFAAEELELSKRLKRFARASGQRLVILHRHPLVTSARKVHLYTIGDHLKLLARVLVRPGTLKRREACTLWYDGRR